MMYCIFGSLDVYPSLHFYHASICDDGLGSRNSVHLFVCLSVTRVDCDKSKWCNADILITI